MPFRRASGRTPVRRPSPRDNSCCAPARCMEVRLRRFEELLERHLDLAAVMKCMDQSHPEQAHPMLTVVKNRYCRISIQLEDLQNQILAASHHDLPGDQLERLHRLIYRWQEPEQESEAHLHVRVLRAVPAARRDGGAVNARIVLPTHFVLEN